MQTSKLGFDRNVDMGLVGRSGRELVQGQWIDVNKAENWITLQDWKVQKESHRREKSKRTL